MPNDPKGAPAEAKAESKAKAEDKGEAKAKEPDRPIDTAGPTEKIAAVRAQLAQAQGQVAALRAQRDSLRLENAQLRDENKELKRATASEVELPPVGELPRGAARLTESTVIICAATGARAHAHRGDVLLMTDDSKAVEAVQRAVGNAARVYGVDEETAKNLTAAGWIQAPG